VDCLEGLSKNKLAKSINTFDFGQMYTNLRHNDIINQMSKVLKLGFGKNENMWVNSHMAVWHEPKNAKSFFKLNRLQIMDMISFIVSNTYFQFGNTIYRQTIGIPMGTDCAPLVANLTLFAYEFVFMTNLLKSNKAQVGRLLSNCWRCIDDITAINDNCVFEKVYKDIYPDSLTLKK